MVEVIFQKRVPVFHQSSKHREASIVSRCLEPLIKIDKRLFEMTSPMKQYQIMQCYIFSISIVCLIRCIQSAFVVFISFSF